MLAQRPSNCRNLLPEGSRPGFGPKRPLPNGPRRAFQVPAEKPSNLPKFASKRLPARLWPKRAVSEWSRKGGPWACHRRLSRPSARQTRRARAVSPPSSEGMLPGCPKSRPPPGPRSPQSPRRRRSPRSALSYLARAQRRNGRKRAGQQQRAKHCNATSCSNMANGKRGGAQGTSDCLSQRSCRTGAQVAKGLSIAAPCFPAGPPHGAQQVRKQAR